MKSALEHIAITEGVSFQVFQRRAKRYQFDWHHHPEVELTLIERGRGRRYVGDSVEDYISGDCVLLGSYLPHTWVSHGRAMQAAIVVQFAPEWMYRLMDAAPELSRIALLLKRCRLGVHFERVGQLAPLIRRLAAEHDSVNRLTLFLTILDRLSRLRCGRVLSGATLTTHEAAIDKRLIAVNEYLRKHLIETITQQQMAEIAELTPSAFCRFFKRSTGRSFVSHLHELRIGHACRLLTETQASITEVCFASGFGNLSNFNRVFRRIKRTNPRHYREQFLCAEAVR